MTFRKAILAIVALCAPCVAAFEASAGDAKDYAIPAGELSQSLKSFTRKAGISVVFDSRLVADHHAPALFGTYTEEQALEKLFQESGLKYEKISSAVWAVTQDDVVVETPPPILTPEPETKVDAVIVTASYLSPLREVGGKALYTIGEEEIRLTGASNVAEPIFDLPLTVATISSANTALLASSSGLNLIDLHGLEPARTLVLVNGRRYVRTNGGVYGVYGVDMNAIPTAFVERIEIVNRAAGATLGTEAVAGAVNIVLREDVDGLTLGVDGGVSAAGDAEEYSVSALAGGGFYEDRGRFTLGFAYASDPSIVAQQREHLTRPSGFTLNGEWGYRPGAEYLRGFGGSPTSERSAVTGAISAVTGDTFIVPMGQAQVIAGDGQSFERFQGREDQLYDWTRDYSILPEIERYSGYGAIDFEFSESHSAYLDFHFSDSDVRSQVAAIPVTPFQGGDPLVGGAIVVSADHPSVPSMLRETVEDLVGEPVSDFLLSRRFVELGPRLRDVSRRNVQLTAGVTGALGDHWRYDISYQYGWNRNLDAAVNVADSRRLAIALDIDQCQMTPGCVPLDIFATSTITEEQAAFIRADRASRTITTEEMSIHAELSSPLYVSRDLEGAVNIGFEHRQNKLRDARDDAFADGTLLSLPLVPGSEGETSFTELFINAHAPVLSEAPGAHSLQVGGAYRFVARSAGSGFSNASVNLSWAPLEGLEFYGQGFWGGRAPNVSELFGAGGDRYRTFADPCDAQQGALSSVCLSDGLLEVFSGFAQENEFVFHRFVPNPGLDHEQVTSSSFGFSAEIDKFIAALPGEMNLTAGWRRRRVDDAIGQFGFQQFLAGCFAEENLQSEFCRNHPTTGEPLIVRDPQTRQITRVDIPRFNGGLFRSIGLDAQLNYQTDLYGLGWVQNLSLDAIYTYTHRFRTQTPFEPEETRLEGLTAFPRHELNVTASFGNSNLSTYWTMRRRGSITGAYGLEHPAARLPAVAYFDAAVQWRSMSDIVLYAGVENIFDRLVQPVAGGEPPLFYGHYDVIGRRFFAGLRADF